MKQHTDIGANAYTGGVATFVSGFQYEAIPAEAIAHIKLLILDALGDAIFGTVLPWSRILINILSSVDITQGGRYGERRPAFPYSMPRWSTARRGNCSIGKMVGRSLQGTKIHDISNRSTAFAACLYCPDCLEQVRRHGLKPIALKT